MRKNQKSNKLGMRIAALGLTLCMIIPMIGSLKIEASAVTSLSGIERIKRQASFSVLEIVPEKGTGSIGYYVDGAEPTANWKSELKTIVGQNKRKTYVDNLFAGLTDAGLMGGMGSESEDFPLTQTGVYREYLPWAKDLPATYDVVTLNQTEEMKVPGIFEKSDTGDYIPDNTYTYDTNGTFVEDAAYYAFGKRNGGTGSDVAYYYQIEFTRVELTDSNVTNYIGIPLYTPVNDAGLPHYDYAGTLKVGGDFTIDDDINTGDGYFTAAVVYGDGTTPYLTTEWDCLQKVTVNADTIPTLVGTTLYYASGEGYATVDITSEFTPDQNTVYYMLKDKAHSYYAIKAQPNAYREALENERGSFKENPGYRYVGNANVPSGTFCYSFKAVEGEAPQNISYNTIYITGGYTNNQWFKRYVLDVEENQLTNLSLNITVNSVTCNDLTTKAIQNADLVVVSAGYDPATGAAISYKLDLNSDYFNAILEKPRLVDTTLSVDESIGSTAYLIALKDGKTTPSVTVNNGVDVYYFAKTIVDENTEVDRLATNCFYTEIEDTSPYQVVADEIEYENQLRDDSDALSTNISMASCIRYIINTHRTVNLKTSLRILDIQPRAKYDGASGPLTVNTVLGWLPSSMQDQLAIKDGDGDVIGYNITINHMSTAALVGKIEDITEEYDLIYIGANEKGKNLPSSMYYANIGDTQPVDGHLRGLLRANEETARYSGNDLTPKKQRELAEFAAAKMPIVVSSTLVSGATSTPTRTLQATISGSGNKLTASYSLTPAPAGTSISDVNYTWKYCVTKGGTWLDAPEDHDGNPATLTLYDNNEYYYRCIVTLKVNGTQSPNAYSNILQRKITGSTGNNQSPKFEKITSPSQYANWYNNNSRCAEGKAVNENVLDRKLTVTVSEYLEEWIDIAPTYTYTWYKLNPTNNDQTAIQNHNSSTSPVLDYNVYYYCHVQLRYSTPMGNLDVVCRSPAYRLVNSSGGGSSASSSFVPVPDGAGSPATIPGTVSSGTLDPLKVDPNSLMSQTLISVWNRENVMVQSELEGPAGSTSLNDNQDTLVKYLNLSRPFITFAKDDKGKDRKPTDYEGDFTKLGTYNCAGELNFTFTINNPTDPDPLQARYRCNVYIDQNGDGRHAPEERISDFDIVDGNSTPVNNGQLKGDTTYTLHRSLNRTQYNGLVAWKLEVVKEGDSTAHASEKGYAYIQPETPTKINVLQIRSRNGEGVDLSSSGNLPALYANLKRNNMYDIDVTVKDVDDLKDRTKYSNEDKIFEELYKYDMIILGFYDCYGELDEATANAVVRFIETGRATLFTHDTTSFYNETETTARRRGINIYIYWGYYFNQIIRDKVGLDRYGVTNSRFMSTNNNPGTNAGTPGAIIESEATELQKAGYTVAYEPGPEKRSAGATQGYTDLNIYNYGSESGEKTTINVSQVNRGQITEYPFKIGSTLTVDETHQQYYQLNMNSDDIVVWYCLSGSGGRRNSIGGYDYNYNDNHYNDVTNAYYIYNRGNITYSGAGHKGTLSGDEERLFVNTMIAAYRAAHSKPTIEFKTASDHSATMLLFPVQTSDTAEDGKRKTESLSGEQYTYFKIQDTNLTANKSIKVELYYDAAESDYNDDDVIDDDASLKQPDKAIPVVKKASIGKIVRADSGTEVSANNLTSGVLYKTVIPAEILNYFATEISGREANIYLKTTTTIHSTSADSSYSGSDALTLQKLGLLRLE